MPPLLIQVFSPSSTQASPASRARHAMAATSDPAPGSDSAKAVMHSPAAQALHREREVGQPVVARQRLAADHQCARIQRLALTAESRRHAVAQHAGLAQHRHQPAAGRIGVAVVDAGQHDLAPAVQVGCQRTVRIVEERKIQMVQACHASDRTAELV
jgi:hypothetical protein